LMEKLQRPSANPQPKPAPALRERARTPPPVPTPVPIKIDPSPCVLLTNMFDPATESEPNWDQEIRNDTSEECTKFGSVVHCAVDMNSGGHVYLKFGSIPAAQNAINALNQRWFASRMITAVFVPEQTYYIRFPEAKNR